ncbi:MAG: 4-phosphoerythronate dehydrogenase [Pseudomonadota bacterium]|nr:4-phosphoerythronate dehydrogenase [Pseudomonadota bacterium]
MTNHSKTIIIDDAVPYAEAIFSHLGNVTTLPGKSINAQTVKNADALIVRSRTQVNAELLDGSTISYVGSTVVGLDHIDQEYLKNNNIHFYSAQGCNANSVAEYIVTVLFELAEKFDFNLTDKTLGIIGVGNVGQKVYNKAKLLGITCLLNDPPRLEKEPGLVSSDNYVDLDQCLTADIITVHTPLTRNGKHPSYNLISADKLKQIKPHQILINAARGGVINEQAWVETKTKANIIDCWENEPEINESLYQSAYLATPHIAGHSLEAKVAGSTMVYKDLCKTWNINTQNDWMGELPARPNIITVSQTNSIQKALNEIFNKTHNINVDDTAIRSNNILELHNKYEKYRRNFPIYREWDQHRIKKTNNRKLNNLLESLDFSLIK